MCVSDLYHIGVFPHIFNTSGSLGEKVNCYQNLHDHEMTTTEDDYTLAHAIGPPLCRIWLLIGPPSPLSGIHCLSHMLVFRFFAF